MNKVIAIVLTIVCVGMLFGCACDTKKSDETTQYVGDVSVAPANSTEAKAAPKKTVIVTAVPTQKTTKKAKKETGPKKTKAKGGNIVGSWTWEGGIFVYTFKKDGTGVYTTGSDAMYFTYKVNGNKVTLKYKDGGDVTMPFTVKGKTLILKDANNDDVTYYKNGKHSNPNK